VQLDVTAHHGTAQQPAALTAATAALSLADGPAHQAAARGLAGSATESQGKESEQQQQQQSAGLAEGTQGAAAAAQAPVPAVNEPSPWLLLQQKGIVGAVRVAARALSLHGLRREPAFQQPPHHAIDS
jgi:hypothetical protein